jgi:hypothetical protein
MSNMLTCTAVWGIGIGRVCGRNRVRHGLEAPAREASPAGKVAGRSQFLTHLLARSMVCGCCGAAIAQVSGRSGGYHDCLAATKGACEKEMLARRTLAERVVVDALKLKEAELTGEQRRLANVVDFTGEGGGSQALAKALVETERPVEVLSDEVEAPQRSRDKVFRAPRHHEPRRACPHRNALRPGGARRAVRIRCKGGTVCKSRWR